MPGIKLLVGLGNPGEKYADTRHNAGFWWIDRIAPLSMPLETKFFGHAVKRAGGEWLLKPSTFMNASGKSVAAICHFYKIQPEEVLVIHDELDLPPGAVKLKKGGGHGGHNGLRDISSALGTPDFWRLRLGIGHPGQKSEVVNFVLNAPSKQEMTLIDNAIDHSLQNLSLIIAGEFEKAMLAIHTKPS